nr:MAG TPA: hypothetical protein [Caudoviricetes sp.]
MNYEDVVALAKAGFTADQIILMQHPQDPKPAEPVPAEPAPAEPVPAEPAPAEPAAAPDLGKLIADGFEKLNETLVKTNLQQAQQPPEETVDDILATIINPPLVAGNYSIKEVK